MATNQKKFPYLEHAFAPAKLGNTRFQKKYQSWSQGAKADTSSIIIQIKHYLDAAFQYRVDNEGANWLVTKPVDQLADDFGCSGDDVIAAIREMKQQGYRFRRMGLNGPIVIYDELAKV